MSDLISRRPLFEEVDALVVADCEVFRAEVLMEILNAPSVPAEVVRHAYWEPMDGTCNHAKEFRCSGAEGCGESIHYDHYTRFCEYEFCPNCGARMDGQGEGDAE